MPCYLFTLHAYRSWMPDNPRGYVQRNKGILTPDDEMARNYVRRAKHDPVLFEQHIQQTMIDALVEGCQHKTLSLHAVYFEPSHIHFLVSWTQDQPWLKVRSSLQRAMTIRLNENAEKRQWFSRAGSRKHVKDRAHFNHLMTTYRQKHKGLHYTKPPNSE